MSGWITFTVEVPRRFSVEGLVFKGIRFRIQGSGFGNTKPSGNSYSKRHPGLMRCLGSDIVGMDDSHEVRGHHPDPSIHLPPGYFLKLPVFLS